jgi:hypothetical protein
LVVSNKCPIAVQLPTIPNFRLKHGSIRGFFDEYSADVICFQVCGSTPSIYRCCITRLNKQDGQVHPLPCTLLQETKLQSEEKLTKEVACVEGFEVSIVIILKAELGF